MIGELGVCFPSRQDAQGLGLALGPWRFDGGTSRSELTHPLTSKPASSRDGARARKGPARQRRVVLNSPYKRLFDQSNEVTRPDLHLHC